MLADIFSSHANGADALGRGGLRAEFVDEIRGALRVGGGGEDGAGVVLEDFEPVRDIGGVILAGFERQFQVGAQERGSEFGNEFLLRVGVAAETVPAEIPVEA